jgi:ferredoxin
MAIKKVWIETGCTACNLCEVICPEVFELTKLATVLEGINYSYYEGKIIEATDGCPAEVIKYDKLVAPILRFQKRKYSIKQNE